jgi:hypothetical protein
VPIAVRMSSGLISLMRRGVLVEVEG